MALSCGLAQCDITPPPGLPMDGYDARQGTAAGVQDPLLARVLYLSDGSMRACIVSLELLGVGNPLAERLRRGIAATTGADPDAVIVAASHTHIGTPRQCVNTSKPGASPIPAKVLQTG